MKKRILGVALAGALAFSAIAGSIATVSAAEAAPPNPNRLPEYTPSAGVETRTVMFAMPGSWIGEEGSTTRQTWEKYGSAAGLYWWGGEDNPDEAPAAASHGWPGWKMKKVSEGDIANLYSTLASRKAPNMIFSNFIDGGMDTSYPEYNTSQQTEDLQVEWFGEGDSDYYPKEFWDYLYNNYEEDFIENPNYQIEEFGDYAKNFFYDDMDESIYQYIDNMVFVTDYHIDPNKVSPVSGKAGFPGAFYFYYGNGEFGIWPTREMCIEKEGLTVDADGKIVYEGTKKNAETGEDEAFTETVDETNGFILRNHTDAYYTDKTRDFVVFGNFTGKYWSDTAAPEIPTVEPTSAAADTTTVPAADNNDATSAQGEKSSSGTGSNNSNGSIATGDYSAAAIFGVFAIAGLGVFYFVRKRRSSK
ncbi:MAG: hypothetical protein U0L27_03420 [Ruminococcus sp.]|nr:hypothetical protein [Ruminococcus sp.]